MKGRTSFYQSCTEACVPLQNGMFGSTQGTVLALKALLAYEQSRLVDRKEGSVALQVWRCARYPLPMPSVPLTTRARRR